MRRYQEATLVVQLGLGLRAVTDKGAKAREPTW